jgi:hypothetical protein
MKTEYLRQTSSECEYMLLNIAFSHIDAYYRFVRLFPNPEFQRFMLKKFQDSGALPNDYVLAEEYDVNKMFDALLLKAGISSEDIETDPLINSLKKGRMHFC